MAERVSTFHQNAPLNHYTFSRALDPCPLLGKKAVCLLHMKSEGCLEDHMGVNWIMTPLRSNLYKERVRVQNIGSGTCCDEDIADYFSVAFTSSYSLGAPKEFCRNPASLLKLGKQPGSTKTLNKWLYFIIIRS